MGDIQKSIIIFLIVNIVTSLAVEVFYGDETGDTTEFGNNLMDKKSALRTNYGARFRQLTGNGGKKSMSNRRLSQMFSQFGIHKQK